MATGSVTNQLLHSCIGPTLLDVCSTMLQRLRSAVKSGSLLTTSKEDLTPSPDSKLSIIIINSVVIGSHSVQAAPCLTCQWCDKVLPRARAERCLPLLSILMSLTAIALMKCSSWSGLVWASLVQLEVPVAPGLQALVYFGRSFGAGHSVSPNAACLLILLSTAGF